MNMKIWKRNSVSTRSTKSQPVKERNTVIKKIDEIEDDEDEKSEPYDEPEKSEPVKEKKTVLKKIFKKEDDEPEKTKIVKKKRPS